MLSAIISERSNAHYIPVPIQPFLKVQFPFFFAKLKSASQHSLSARRETVWTRCPQCYLVKLVHLGPPFTAVADGLSASEVHGVAADLERRFDRAVRVPVQEMDNALPESAAHLRQ